MNKKVLLLAALLAIAVAGGLFLLFGDREETKINRTLNKMVETFRKNDKEGIVESARRAQFFARHFISQPAISIAGFNLPLNTQNDIQSTVFQVRSAVRSISVKVFDRSLAVAPTRRDADMRFTARAQFNLDEGTETAAHEFHLQWTKTNAEWRIAVVESRDVFENE